MVFAAEFGVGGMGNNAFVPSVAGLTVNRLSDFAFVVEDTRVQVGALKINRVAFIAVLIFWWILLLIAIIIFILSRRRENRRYGR